MEWFHEKVVNHVWISQKPDLNPLLGYWSSTKTLASLQRYKLEKCTLQPLDAHHTSCSWARLTHWQRLVHPSNFVNLSAFDILSASHLLCVLPSVLTDGRYKQLCVTGLVARFLLEWLSNSNTNTPLLCPASPCVSFYITADVELYFFYFVTC